MKLHESRCHFREVGRATVPADTGRHGGRPYVSTRLKFLFRFDWTLAARSGAHMKLHELKANRRISNIEGWDRFAQPFFKIDRIHYSMLDVGRSMFISFSFD